MDQIAQFGHKESLKCAPAARYPLTFYSYMRSTSQALSFMFEWIFVVGLGAKVKRDWAKPRISVSQLCGSCRTGKGRPCRRQGSLCYVD